MTDSELKMVLVRTILTCIQTHALVHICLIQEDGQTKLDLHDENGNFVAKPTIIPNPGYTFAALSDSFRRLTADDFSFGFIITDYDRSKQMLSGWKPEKFKADWNPDEYCHC